MSMRLYIANKNYSSWSLRPWVLMKHLGLAFEEVLVPFGPQAPVAFVSFSPTGKVPCLVNGPLTVWDSLAIVEYLAEQAPAVWPLERAARAWARSASAEMHAGFAAVRHYCSMSCGQRVKLHPLPPDRAAELAAQWARIDQVWQQGLARFGGPFLAGAAFTAVDAFYAPVAFRAQTYGQTLSAASQAYAQRLLALPAMQQWYQDALAETWRDQAHEADIRALGEIIRDDRTSLA